jgi:prepilin peptidase CpaA
MPGLASLILLVAFCTAVGYFDLRFGRIPNILNAAGFASGPIVAFATCGTGALVTGLAGALLGLAIMLVPFLLHMVAGGDVKFLAAAGSIIGWRVLMPGFLAGAALGGAIGIALMLRRERSLSGLRRRLVLLEAGCWRQHRGASGSGASVQGDIFMPYAIPLSIGLITVTFINCFK